MAGATATAAGEAGVPTTINGAMGMNSVRGFGGLLSYVTSKWALSCFTMASYSNPAATVNSLTSTI